MSAEVLLRARALTVGFPPGFEAETRSRRGTGSGRAPGFSLDSVDLELRAGETLALVGASGSGKSTLALALLGLIPAGAQHLGGSVELDGRDLFTLPRAELERVRGKQIGLVFQEPLTALNPVLTIGEQVAEGLRLHRGLNRADAARAAIEVLAEVGLPDPARAAGQFAHQLSGGMRQRALIAMAIAPGPRILVADEPTTALDATVRAQVLALFERLAGERGMALVLVSHDLGVVARMADRVAVLAAGRVVEVGPVDQLLAAGEHAATRALAEAARASGAFAAERPGEGAPALELSLSRPVRAPRLEVLELVVEHPGRASFLRRPVPTRAVRGVSFEVAPGEVLALVGESGCGKSSLARSLAGLLEPTSGSAWLHGREGRRSVFEPRSRRRVAMVFQDPQSSLNPRHRAVRIVGEAPVVHGLVTAAEARSLVDRWLARVGLPDSAAERYPHEFSGGQRQRLAIARALAVEPEVLILDEATSSLDAPVRAEVLELLEGLARELSLAVLFVTHDLGSVRRLADRVAVMYLGQLVEVGTNQQVFGAPVHPYTRALLAAEAYGPGALLAGEVPSPLAPPAGCAFHPRCPLAEDRCRERAPEEVVYGTQRARCHLVEPPEADV